MDQEIISLHVGELDVIPVVKLGTLLVNNRCFNLYSKASPHVMSNCLNSIKRIIVDRY